MLEAFSKTFWDPYPARNGQKKGRPNALRHWIKLTEDERQQVAVAVKHYASSLDVQRGIGIKDPERWLRSGKGDEPWREWLEATPKSRTCIASVPLPDKRGVRPCGAPAAPGQDRPICEPHLRAERERLARVPVPPIGEPDASGKESAKTSGVGREGRSELIPQSGMGAGGNA